MDRRTMLAGFAGLAAAGCRADGNPLTGQARADLYRCEGCEGAAERPAEGLSASARIGPAGEPGEPLVLAGIVLGPDGRTPAPGVVAYAYHTNAAGLYANGTAESEWSRRHGRLRGWARTGADGRYRFETIKPAPYPGQRIPAHIHLIVLEPGRRPYWIDDVVFDGEFGVDAAYRAAREDRGGNGIVRLARDSQRRLLAARDIILERHPD